MKSLNVHYAINAKARNFVPGKPLLPIIWKACKGNRNTLRKVYYSLVFDII